MAAVLETGPAARRGRRREAARSASELGPGAVIAALVARLVPSAGERSEPASDAGARDTEETQRRHRTKAELMWRAAASRHHRQQVRRRLADFHDRLRRATRAERGRVTSRARQESARGRRRRAR